GHLAIAELNAADVTERGFTVLIGKKQRRGIERPAAICPLAKDLVAYFDAVDEFGHCTTFEIEREDDAVPGVGVDDALIVATDTDAIAGVDEEVAVIGVALTGLQQ